MRALSDLYFRAEVRGLSNVPAGPVLLVGNHSGGWLIADTFVFGQALLRPLRPRAQVPVEWHLHKVFGKLGITSRMALLNALPDDSFPSS